MSTHYSQTIVTSKPFLTSFDIDSVYVFSASLAIYRQGIRWFPDMYIHFNITANVHLGLLVPPDATSVET